MPRTTTRSAQQSPVDESLADRLIDAAEVLYAVHGIGGASLRQISAAAGTANNYAVQYHFGSAAGLIRGLLEKRMPEIERQRATLLAKVKAAGRIHDVRALNEVMYRPLVEYSDPSGERRFARFSLALLSSSQRLDLSAGTEHLAPVSEHIFDLQRAAAPAIPAALLRERHRLIASMILMSVFHSQAAHSSEVAAAFEDALEMATAALIAPVSKSVRAQLRKRRGSRSA